ncbi:hypothetical protein SAMN05216337_109314 [Bradyrhizobium brasilense]|uniref:Uncharacterized protein n=1 Tax=Bradyrhizobium brasilense TaxID=1419277 RepID=A0A1G7Q9S7_9BRAD|nr:hypothetical protein [Bradyrhizobium brasilense]SDF95266.1 hypothetical protein SAMN05216337_109314 [Bradyrhizobium brasilense]
MTDLEVPTTQPTPGGKRKLWAPEKLAEFRTRLQALPPIEARRSLTQTEMIRALNKDIEALRKRGYGPSDICKALAELGFSISPNALAKITSGKRGKKAATKVGEAGPTKPGAAAPSA